MAIALDLLGLFAGIGILVWSADVFVGGAAALARRCGISPLLVGMVVIGFGTSLPEMMVSLLSALAGSPSIALGNAYGSNVANICLILGLTALLKPIRVPSGVLRRELPILLVATAICGFLLFDHMIRRVDALAMLAIFGLVLVNNIAIENRRESAGEPEQGTEATGSVAKMVAKIVVGLALVTASSRLLVVCAVRLAQAMGVSDLVIGLTVVAIGTSLPELASSLAAIRKNEHDLAIGNIVGSNLFNTLVVVGIAGSVAPMVDETSRAMMRTVLVRDYPAMTGLTVLLLVFCIPFRKGHPARINRFEGAVLLAGYIVYMAALAMGGRV